ncbi:MAG: HIT domain-containing protein [Candidatus Levybacteria bacterium]|nr:HIT domain-containing protein [Candidatus Levybacteria bacterium]
MDCVFCKIRDREIPKEFIYEDGDVMVFPDIHPVKPVHLLIVPKKHIEDFLFFEEDAILPKIKKIIQEIIKKQKIQNKGYRIVINGGGAQIINHLHIHIMGPMGQKGVFL